MARVRVDDSAFAPPAAPPSAPPATLVAIESADRLDWRGAENLYARIAVYLRPGGSRPPIRDFAAWADDPETFRESGSIAYDGHPWEERDPRADGRREPGRSFRLSLPRSVAARPGARAGPTGALPPPGLLAMAPPPSPESGHRRPALDLRADRVARPGRRNVTPIPAAPAIGPERPGRPAEDEMKEIAGPPSPPARPAETRGGRGRRTRPSKRLPPRRPRSTPSGLRCPW